MTSYTDFHVHGDNIVECERTFDVIIAALSDELASITGPYGAPVCPEFQLHLKTDKVPLHITFYPGFGRWNEDILQNIRERGGVLREAADAIITAITSDVEQPLIAIEYCGALPAGNQAWQRNGRAYSFGRARIPYLYVAELGGFELDSSRNRKAPRMPNPAVPFSYLSYSLEQNTPVLPVFLTSPGADESSRIAHADEFADQELVALVRAGLLNENSDDTYAHLRNKVLAFIRKRSESSRHGNTLTPQQWVNAYHALTEHQSLVEFLVKHVPVQWSKTAYIEALTESAKALMNLAAKFAIGLTSSDLPLCIVPQVNRVAFASDVEKLYPNLPDDFKEWLKRKQHLVVCWVMGFKPAGDDARPDRGLPPLARMLIGEEHDLLSIVYGPAPATTWPALKEHPATLIERNGLWESILAVSDALLVDASTDHVTNNGFLRSHWEKAIPESAIHAIFVKPLPKQLGENDVDTVLHTLLGRFAGASVYEGMCNPPGGDWSGVSLQPPDRSCELRWLSLPRVSGPETKRPDHVFQLFGIAPKPIILSIESKETPTAVEPAIGPRLSAYIHNLIASPASIKREGHKEAWIHSIDRLNPADFNFASAVAFISGSQADIDSVIARAHADLILAYTFNDRGKSCDILMKPQTNTGSIIADYCSHLNPSANGITIHLH